MNIASSEHEYRSTATQDKVVITIIAHNNALQENTVSQSIACAVE